MATCKCLKTEYEALCGTERTKSNTYSHIFTIAITIIVALVSLYASNPVVNSKILLVIPIVLLVWFSFVLYNMLYLRIIRLRLAFIEKKLKEKEPEDKGQNKDEIPQWFSGIYPKIVTKGLSRILIVVNIFIFLGITLFSLWFGYDGFKQFLCEYNTPFETYIEWEAEIKKPEISYAKKEEWKKLLDRANFWYSYIVLAYVVIFLIISGCNFWVYYSNKNKMQTMLSSDEISKT